MEWTLLFAAIGASVVGQGLLKAGAARPDFMAQLLDWKTVLGLGIFGGSAMLYIAALRKIPLSVALPCTALSYVVVTVIGYALFAEPVGLQKLAALALIVAGVAVLATA
jgi:small multidrug resistance pump